MAMLTTSSMHWEPLVSNQPQESKVQGGNCNPDRFTMHIFVGKYERSRTCQGGVL